MVREGIKYAIKLPFIRFLSLLMTTVFLGVLAESAAAEAFAFSEKMDLRVEIASIHFQIGRGHDALGSAKKDAAFTQRAPDSEVNPGDELDVAADLKFLAFEEYLTAMKQWTTIAKSMGPGRGMINNQTATVNADIAWESCKRALDEAIAFHRQAQEYFDSVNNFERKTAVLGKLARNLQRRLDLKR